MTKSITAYVGMPIAGQAVDFLDTPGVGDTDVSLILERLMGLTAAQGVKALFPTAQKQGSEPAISLAIELTKYDKFDVQKALNALGDGFFFAVHNFQPSPAKPASS